MLLETLFYVLHEACWSFFLCALGVWFELGLNPDHIPLKCFTYWNISFTLATSLLWNNTSAFTLAFYGFLHVSEFTGTSLQWSDLQLNAQHLSVTISQSKTDLFHRGHVLHLLSTGTSTCPVKALHQYTAMIPHNRRLGPLFSSGKFLPFIKSTAI